MTLVNQAKFFESMSAAADADTMPNALAHIEAAVRALGYERYALMDRDGLRGVRSVHHNAGTAWAGATASAMERNPAVQRAMMSPIPFSWDQRLYADRGAERTWAEQAAHGYASGICASYGAHDSRACIVVGASAGPSVDDPGLLHQLYGNLLLLAGVGLTVMKRFATPEVPSRTVKLRPRELECLHWVLENKTAWEISVILGISERTVNQHLSRARAELDVASTKVAATRAFQLQLLPPRLAS